VSALPAALPQPRPPRAAGLTPREIVAELDRYIVGQAAAKRAVAIALRHRWRRMQVDDALRDEILPANIIMIGPTGVGKTEIARRLAKVAGVPFVKVEATKFTERGYVGRDVDSMVRDLVEVSLALVREEMTATVQEDAGAAVEDRLLDLLLPPLRDAAEETRERWERSRDKLRAQLRAGELEGRNVTVETTARGGPMLEVLTPGADEVLESGLQDALRGLFPARKKERSVPIVEARKILHEQEVDRRIDHDRATAIALQRAETGGIIFLDEIDKIASRREHSGIDVSREGVQRDLLPVVEGCTVQTKYGAVRTDHVLFIAAGAFHISKPSDLIPELQGRFPIRVELASLTEEDFVRILQEPENSLPRQYCALLATEHCQLEFTADAYRELATIACEVNRRRENIGARRLHTIMSALLEDLLYELPAAPGAPPPAARVAVDAAFVRRKLAEVLQDEDLSRYIL
jgi:ATP-dependent HslUV protease ATP-binding subunit HslU